MTMNGRRWRILLTVFNQTGKGTYWRAFHWGRVLAARGHAVTLMAMSSRARLRLTERDVDGVHLVETPDLLPGSLRSGWDAWETIVRIAWLSGRRFDIVHTFESRPTVIFPALCARKSKLVMDWCDWFGRGGSVEERPNPLVRAVLRPVETFFEEHFRVRADGTTVINTFLRERAVALGVRAETILLIRNGSDVSFVPPGRDDVRRALGLELDTPLIGYVGGIYTRDAELMAAAFNLVWRADLSARLVLVGYFNRDIEALLDDPAAVIRTGPVASPQMYQWLATCDVCWLPLRDSGANRGRWPFKLNDYMTVGRPVVATGVGDLPGVIEQYQLGVVARDDAKDFAACTLALLADVPRRVMLGQAARRAAETVFRWEGQVDDLEAFYRQLIEGV
jgi:glycosyltransferase involved in cell wall biosynthesis